MRQRRRGKNSTAAVNDFDSIEIRCGKSAKFDGAGVNYSQFQCTQSSAAGP